MSAASAPLEIWCAQGREERTLAMLEKAVRCFIDVIEAHKLPANSRGELLLHKPTGKA